MKKSATILGASGLIGSQLLKLLLANNNYTEVFSISRKPLGIEHPKLTEYIGDLLDESFLASALKNGSQHVFCAIGSTQAKTPDLVRYKQIDFGIPTDTARLAIKANLESYVVISSMGANAKSKVFYSRTKGQMEEALISMGIANLKILRPSLLLGNRAEKRLGEQVGSFFMKNLSWLIPKRYQAIESSVVAKAMLLLANSDTDKVVYESSEINEVVNGTRD